MWIPPNLRNPPLARHGCAHDTAEEEELSSSGGGGLGWLGTDYSTVSSQAENVGGWFKTI
jgi:hypothetical protein